MKALRSLRIGLAFALAIAASGAGAADESPWKFEFHGFVTGTLYYQQEVFVGGQGQALVLLAPSPANFIDEGDNSSLGGDVRQSRFAFSAAGPKVFDGVAPRGYLEFDLLGGPGAGSLGAESVLPRIRVAFAELKLGDTVVQVGQQNQLIIAQIPDSVSHIANPIVYGAGLIGWRTPGVRVTHTLPMDGWKLALAAEVVRNRWADCGAAACAATSPVTISQGEASSLPMIQARALADGKAGDLTWVGYLAGAYHWVDLNGVGSGIPVPAAYGTKTELTGYAVVAGGKVVFQPVVVALNAYTGKAIGNLVGSLFQYGDIADVGAWAQVGVFATKEISIWGLYGMDRPDKTDVRKFAGNTARLTNDVYGGQIKYASAPSVLAPGYSFALEAFQNSTDWSLTATTSKKTTATQIAVSGAYNF